ncbi:MAG TPA: hypothetical protein DC010_04220 [Psychrobacter sp.]|nr:hypothetical protein [Psychrobacter sp.]
MILAESLACGTPVIGFDVGACAEIVTSETGIVVAKEDKAAFIKAFDSIKNISRAACRARAKLFCADTTMVDGYLDLYYQTLTPEQQSLSTAQKPSAAMTKRLPSMPPPQATPSLDTLPQHAEG